MSEKACVFTLLERSADLPTDQQITCEGPLYPLCDISHTDSEYGNVNPVDELLMRGAIFIDWSDQTKSKETLSMKVCLNHKQKLLTNWKRNPCGNKYNFKKKLTCSLPNIKHMNNIRPVTTRRLRKEDVLALLSFTGRFTQVGTAVCRAHDQAIREEKWNELKFTDPMFADDTDADNGECRDSEEYDADEKPDNNEDAEYSPDQDLNISFDSEGDATIEKTPEQKRDEAFRVIASYYGITRLTSKLKWDAIEEDTRRKKISAGECWESMKDDCLRKIGLTIDSSRVNEILQSIDQRLEETSDRKGRLNLLSAVTGHFSEKEIMHATGVSKYYIQEAKKFALWGLEDVVKHKRVQYDLQKLKSFVSFILRPEIIVSLPKPGRALKLSSGDSICLASVARLQSYRQVHGMFLRYLEIQGQLLLGSTAENIQEFVRSHSLGYSTCVKLMEAFDTALNCVTELRDKQKIDGSSASDLTRRLTVTKNYLCGYFRMHLSVSSNCPSHCLTFALSDCVNREFQKSCDHDHQEDCEQCREILTTFAQFKSFLIDKSSLANQIKDADRYRIGRMVEECEDSESKVQEFQKHLVRAAMSELDRIRMMDTLQESWAMLTMDFSLKLMPTGFVEAQSQWFGKCGISFHVTHVLTKKGDVKYNHTLGHLNDEPKQDCMAICAIADHVFRVLSENGVKIVVVRSDNAGNYKNAGVVFTLREIAAKYGLTLSAYLFSEPQSGKGAADRKIGDAKRKLVSVVDSGRYGRNAGEILKSLTTEPLLKSYSFYQIKGELVKRADSTIHGITNLSSFRYEDDGIRKKVTDREETIDYGREEEESFFRCPEESCSAKYRTLHYLNNHLLIGKHKIPKHTDTVVDAAAKMFSETVETNESAYLSMRVDSLSSANHTARSLSLKEGWAVRVKNRTTTIDPSVRRAVRRYFIERRRDGKRAEAREITQLIRNATDPDGKYLYPLKKCLRETQAQGLIGRFLRVEASKEGLNALESGGEDELDEDDSEEEGDCDVIQVPVSRSMEGSAIKRTKGRPKNVALSTGKKTIVRKTKVPAPKKTVKTNARKNKKNAEERSENNNNADGELELQIGTDKNATPHNAHQINDESSMKKRGRPKKAASAVQKTPKKKTEGSKERLITKEAEETQSSSRVTRSQKRRSTKEMTNYCELSSDEEMDDFTMFMNAAIENRHEIFTDAVE